tara:strand:+ start:336 stop:494 length:159 start_codon:yes stop_codon:yes gene_type:complete
MINRDDSFKATELNKQDLIKLSDNDFEKYLEENWKKLESDIDKKYELIWEIK